MSATRQGRDYAPALVAALSTLLSLRVLGLSRAEFLPATVFSLLPALLSLALFWLIAVGPGGGWRRALGSAFAAAPPLALCTFWAAGPNAPVPAASAGALALFSIALCALPPRARRICAAALLAVLLTDLVLAHSQQALLRPELNALHSPLAPSRSEPATRVGPAGLRLGAPVALEPGEVHPLARGPGPWWQGAASEVLPRTRPVLLAYGGPGDLNEVVQRLGGSLIQASTLAATDEMDLEALGLDAVDVIWVGTKGWEPADPRAERRSRAIAGFVRRGGVLVGPPSRDPWPSALGPALGVAGAPVAGTDDGAPLRTLGLGRVIRPGDAQAAEALLADRGWVQPVATMLDGAFLPPPPLPGQPRFGTHSASTGSQGGAAAVLVLHAVALALLGLLLRGRAALLSVLLVSGGAVAVLAAQPRPAGAQLDAVVLELGGAGGRRVQTLRIHAGPGGFSEPIAWEGGGIVRLLGGRLTESGEVFVGPGQIAWVVREAVGLGLEAQDQEARDAAWLGPLIVGSVDPKALRYGRLEGVRLWIAGEPRPFSAQTLRYTPLRR